MDKFRKKIVVVGIIVLSGWLGLRFIYYGSLFRNCVYTEQNIQMNQWVATGKFSFVGPAAIISEPYRPYECLPEFKSIQSQIMRSENAYRHDDGSPVDPQKITSVDASSKIELYPVRLVAVRKHGITTIDSGGGPTVHLVLRDQRGALYQIPTVYLGINKGDEFLQLIRSDGTTELLSAKSKLSEH